LLDPNNTPERTASLKHKIAVMKRMYANCKRVPFEWDRHQTYAKTPAGMGVHTINIDGDIGPMLQAMKLKTLKDIAEKNGIPSLRGEIELMNLAGPMTGLEMMDAPWGRGRPRRTSFPALLRKQDGDRAHGLRAAGRTRPAHGRCDDDGRFA
jgi:hypothetical protein